MAGRETAARRKRGQESQKAALAALLQKIDVFSNQSKDSVSVLGGTTNVMYWESILSDSVRATVTFTDAGNTLRTTKNTRRGRRPTTKKVSAVEGLPIEGSEEVYLKFQDNDGNTLNFGKQNNNSLYVNQVIDLPTGSESGDKSYMLDLAPLEWITNEKGGQQVRKVFSGQISDHVRTIFKDVLKTKKNLDIEETKSTLDFCGNNTKPYYTLNDLSTKAVSKYTQGEGATAGYFFWETTYAYHFKSIDNLMGQGDKKKIIYNESAEGLPPSYNVKAFELETNNQVNVQKKLQMGAYSNRFLGFNPLSMEWTNSLTEAEKNERDDMIELAGEKLPTLNKRFNLDEADSEFSRSSLQFITTGQLNVGKIDGQLDKSKEINFDAPMIFNQAVMRYNQLFASQVTVVIPGDFSLHAGDSVWVDMPQIDVTEKKACGDEVNRETGGSYLITDLCHYITASDTYTKLVLTRDSFGRKGSPDREKGVLVKTMGGVDLNPSNMTKEEIYEGVPKSGGGNFL